MARINDGLSRSGLSDGSWIQPQSRSTIIDCTLRARGIPSYQHFICVCSFSPSSPTTVATQTPGNVANKSGEKIRRQRGAIESDVIELLHLRHSEKHVLASIKDKLTHAYLTALMCAELRISLASMSI